jgi:hypothetical protein
VGVSSNGPLMLDDPSLLCGLVATTPVPCAPIVAMGAMRPSLLVHNNSDRTIVVGHLPIATECYGPLAHKHIIVLEARKEDRDENFYAGRKDCMI